MTLQFSAQELEDLDVVQTMHMMDTCLIAEPTVTTNVYNLPEESFTWNPARKHACGFDGHPSRELLSQVPDSQAVVRLPIDTTITHRARVRITKRHGRTITPITFAVIGQPRQGPSGLLVWLTKITDGSDA
jgi:hypothetical protein